MKISDRLFAVASFVKENANVADVGADHGLLEIHLISNKLVKSVFAIENKNGPFETLKNNLKDYDVTLSLSDGISEIPDYIDTVVIAGMGGILISNILKAHKEKLNDVNQIVIDAHRDVELVRREVTKLGYYIEKEKIVYENGIYYFVISFLKGHKDYDESVYEWGYKIKDDPLFEQFRKEELIILSSNLINSRSSKRADSKSIEEKEAKIRRLMNL